MSCAYKNSSGKVETPQISKSVRFKPETSQSTNCLSVEVTAAWGKDATLNELLEGVKHD